MHAMDPLSTEADFPSEKPPLGKILSRQVLDWKKPAANDCCIREKPEVKRGCVSGVRYSAKDPIRFDGGDSNLYGYVLGDPVNFIDESGLSRSGRRGGNPYGGTIGNPYNVPVLRSEPRMERPPLPRSQPVAGSPIRPTKGQDPGIFLRYWRGIPEMNPFEDHTGPLDYHDVLLKNMSQEFWDGVRDDLRELRNAEGMYLPVIRE